MGVELVDFSSIDSAHLNAWQQLFEADPCARFYHHPHWYRCIAEHLSPGTLNLGFLYTDNVLQLVLPLCDSSSDCRRTHPSHDHLSLNDVLVHPTLKDNDAELPDAIQTVLNAVGRNWVDWQVSNVPQFSTLIRSLCASEPTLLADKPTSSISFFTRSKQSSGRWLLSPTRYTASFDCSDESCPPTGKLRRNLRRLRKQLEETGNLRVDSITDAEALPDAYQHFLDIEASGWKGTGESATAIQANPSLTAFYNALLTPQSAGMQPEINLLWRDDQCIAAQFGLRTGTCLSLLKIGYNEEYARFSPGYLLLESVLGAAATRGIQTLSLVTSPPWAERWHPDNAPVWQVRHYNQSSLGTALHQFNRLKQVAKSRLKQAA